MVFCSQICSDLLWEEIVLVIEKKILKFEAEGGEFAKFLRSLEQFMEVISNKLEQLELKLEKNIGI